MFGYFTYNISELTNSMEKSTISHSYDTLVPMRKQIDKNFDKKEKEKNTRIRYQNHWI